MFSVDDLYDAKIKPAVLNSAGLEKLYFPQ
jgi:hypothetical protein